MAHARRILRPMSDDGGTFWSRSGKAGFLLVLGSIGMLVLSETVLRSDHEVFYSRPTVSSHCRTTAGREWCWVSASFAIANNGRVAQDDVRIEWGIDAQRWPLFCGGSDLIGSAKPRRAPRLTRSEGAATLAYDIREFDPNTILDCSVDCMRCSREDIAALEQAAFAVTGQGVVEADPRATIFVRFFVNAGRVLGALSP